MDHALLSNVKYTTSPDVFGAFFVGEITLPCESSSEVEHDELGDAESFKLVPVVSNELETIKNLFQEQCGPDIVHIYSVRKVINLPLLRQFAFRKVELSEQERLLNLNTSSSANSLTRLDILYHASRPETHESIAHGGFNSEFAKSGRRWYGKGFYFSKVPNHKVPYDDNPDSFGTYVFDVTEYRVQCITLFKKYTMNRVTRKGIKKDGWYVSSDPRGLLRGVAHHYDADKVRLELCDNDTRLCKLEGNSKTELLSTSGGAKIVEFKYMEILMCVVLTGRKKVFTQPHNTLPERGHFLCDGFDEHESHLIHSEEGKGEVVICITDDDVRNRARENQILPRYIIRFYPQHNDEQHTRMFEAAELRDKELHKRRMRLHKVLHETDANIVVLRLDRLSLASLPSKELARFTSLNTLRADQNLLSNVSLDERWWEPLTEVNLICNMLHSFELSPQTMRHVTTLNLSHNKLTSLPRAVFLLPSLYTLLVSHNYLDEMPVSVGPCVTLRVLELDGNRLTTLPADMGNLQCLQRCVLSHNALRELPPSIATIHTLQTLDVAHNDLRGLPPTLCELVQLDEFIIHNNERIEPRELLRLSETHEIQAKLAEMLRDGKPFDQVKLLILGQEATGKTSLVRALKNYRKKKVVKKLHAKKLVSTDGIDVSKLTFDINADVRKEYAIKLKAVRTTVFDFGGQEVYMMSHGFFVTTLSVYLVVFDLSKPETDDRVGYWFECIAASLTHTQNHQYGVILVGTHLDVLDGDASARFSSILRNYAGDRVGVTLAQCVAVSCATGEGLQECVDLIASESLKLDGLLDVVLPRYYDDFIKYFNDKVVSNTALRFQADLPLVSLARFEDEMMKATHVSRAVLHNIISFWHRQGELLHFEHSAQLRQFVIARPMWLADLMATLISIRSIGVVSKNGLVALDKLKRVCWRDFHDDVHDFLVRVLRRFGVLVAVDRQGTYLVPPMIGFGTAPSFGDDLAMARFDATAFDKHITRVYRLSFVPRDFFARFLAALLQLVSVECMYWSESHVQWVDLSEVCCAYAVVRVNREHKEVLLDVASVSDDDNHVREAQFRLAHAQLLRTIALWVGLQCRQFVKCGRCERCEWPLSDVMSGDEIVCGEHVLSRDRLVPESACRIVPSSVQLITELGSGACAALWSGRYGNNDVAVKVLHAVYGEVSTEILMEVEVLSRLRHHNLMQVIGITSVQGDHPAVLLECASGGSLLCDAFESHRSLTLALRFRVAIDIATALHYLHEVVKPALVHRAVRSPSVWLTRHDHDNDTVSASSKLGTFGIAANATDEVTPDLQWQAPECTLGAEHDQQAADVYSYGVLLWELYHQRVPPHTRVDGAVHNNVLFDTSLYADGDDGGVSNVLHRVSVWCLGRDVAQRPSIGTVLTVLHATSNENVDATATITTTTTTTATTTTTTTTTVEEVLRLVYTQDSNVHEVERNALQQHLTCTHVDTSDTHSARLVRVEPTGATAALHARVSLTFSNAVGGESHYNVVSVSLCVNADLLTKFHAFAESMSETQRSVAPMMLFHYADPHALRCIALGGMDTARCKDGWYGRGIYFSPFCDYSLEQYGYTLRRVVDTRTQEVLCEHYVRNKLKPTVKGERYSTLRVARLCAKRC